MKSLNEQQIKDVIDWMNKWDQLRHTIIPIRFREDFMPFKVNPMKDVKHLYEEEKPVAIGVLLDTKVKQLRGGLIQIQTITENIHGTSDIDRVWAIANNLLELTK